MSQPRVTVEMVSFKMIDYRLHVFLQQSDDAEDIWCLPSIGIDPDIDKNLEGALRRGMQSVVGATPLYFEQIKTIGNATRYPDQWLIAVVYMGLFSASCEIFSDAHGQWYSCDTLETKIRLAFDHQGVVNSCVKQLRQKARFTSLPLHLAPAEFSLSDAQRLYESLLSAQLEKKSFRRRLLDANIILPLDKVRRTHSRPAKLYALPPGHIVHHFRRNMIGRNREATDDNNIDTT